MNKKLEKVLDESQQVQKRFKNLLPLFKETLNDKEKKEAIELYGDKFLKLFKQCVQHLCETQKSLRLLVIHIS